jgi:hypothetical protein
VKIEFHDARFIVRQCIGLGDQPSRSMRRDDFVRTAPIENRLYNFLAQQQAKPRA